MKRKWHIQARMMVTMIGLTCMLLLVVALGFNISVKSYIRSRVSNQLATVSKSAYDERQGQEEHKGGKRFNDHPDRITGTRGNAIVLDDQGTLINNLHGERHVGEELAIYFAQDTLHEMQNEVVSVESGSYAVSTTKDPAEEEAYIVCYVDVTAIMAFANQVNKMLMTVILIAIALSIILSRWFAHSLAEPVKTLSLFAREIGQGNLAEKDLSFHDVEFTGLADSMNHMATELLKTKQQQETFFQNVSHELRTPLTSIRGNAEGIAYGIMEPTVAAKVILYETDQLGNMVEDLLYLSRMGRTIPEGKAEPLDLRDILSLCVSEQRSDTHGITFDFDFTEEPVLYPMREQDAQHLFSNLISNAIRYAQNTVKLTCRKNDDTVYISVSDDGPGISEEDMPHVFERFYKGEKGKHGIGLAIAMSIAKKYNGTLRVHNDNGAVFEVYIPISEAYDIAKV